MSKEPEYSFEAWQRKAGKYIGRETVSISKMGRLTISDDFFEKHFSLEFSTIEVFVDKKSNAIGLKPSNNQTGYSPKKTGSTGKARTYDLRDLCVRVNIKPFLYHAKWSEKYQMLIFTFEILKEDTQE